ncbi:sporulation protein [Lachnoclostridium sp. An169]|uniref:GerW family sporulation protein n=1 Tax=Lachnoclostridium sp. An169 TaxID=1965569 RepID=UPI000B36A95C|nr:GerW family sporulation protein [Lachnoclostridium sp. An169]OUP84942.1 sporulation protein [Lachnoclostridium sp. An169]
MSEEKNIFKATVESLFKGMDGIVSSKTVVGDAIHINGTIILPLVDVSFGMGAGSFTADKKEKGMGGIGGRMSPSAVIVIQDGRTKLVNIRNQDTVTKILDMLPDLVDRFTEKKEERMTERDVMDILDADEKDSSKQTE